MKTKDCPNLNKHLGKFKKLIHDCLHRRAIFENVLESIKNPNVLNGNTFLAFYQVDYLRSQLADLRKFFDQDSRVYQFSYITNHLNSKKLKNKHHNLSQKWQRDFKDSANKISFHQEKNYSPKLLNVKNFNKFLNSMKSYFDEIHDSLYKDGFELISNDFLEPDLLKESHQKHFENFLESTRT